MTLINENTLSQRVSIMPMRQPVLVYSYKKVDQYETEFSATAELKQVNKQESGGESSGTVERDSREIVVMRHELGPKSIKMYDIIKTNEKGLIRFWQVDSISTRGLGARIYLQATQCSDPSIAAGIT